MAENEVKSSSADKKKENMGLTQRCGGARLGARTSALWANVQPTPLVDGEIGARLVPGLVLHKRGSQPEARRRMADGRRQDRRSQAGRWHSKSDSRRPEQPVSCTVCRALQCSAQR